MSRSQMSTCPVLVPAFDGVFQSSQSSVKSVKSQTSLWRMLEDARSQQSVRLLRCQVCQSSVIVLFTHISSTLQNFVWWRRVSMEVKDISGVISPSGRRETPPLHPTKPCLKHALPGYNPFMAITKKSPKERRSCAGPHKFNPLRQLVFMSICTLLL